MTDIYRNLEAEIPHLRRYARALTRDAVAGLVQNVAHENLASRFSRNAVTPSRASGW